MKHEVMLYLQDTNIEIPYFQLTFTALKLDRIMAETITKAPVILTKGAITQLKRIMKEQNVTEEYGLRIGVKGGGCSGFTYILGFDIMKSKDQVFELEGMKVFMEKSHGMYLMGMEIDWVDGLNNRGFTFNNPNATESCGCGTSFSA